VTAHTGISVKVYENALMSGKALTVIINKKIRIRDWSYQRTGFFHSPLCIGLIYGIAPARLYATGTL
jgi:hypothetical protein